MITKFKKKEEKEKKEKVSSKKEEDFSVKKKEEKISKTPEKEIKVKKDLKIEPGKIIVAPIISEKSTFLEEENKYVFKVFKNANKPEIKKAIESIYNVKVKKVNIINTKSKKRRLGRIEGKKSGYKKAVVKLKEGQKIEVVPR